MENKNAPQLEPEYVNPFLNMLLGAALLCGLIGSAIGQELVFSPAADARRILSTKDAFVERLSPFDRSSRMKTDRAIAEGEFLEFVASAALEWEPREKDAIDSAFREVRPAVARLLRPIPGRINVIKTSGREEGNVPYTRGNAIIFPTRALASPRREIQKVLAHEVFHVTSRAHPSIVKPLYGSIGFQYCGEIEFPANLAPRKITNPDAPNNDYCIRLQVGGERVWAVPILFSNTPKYDISRGGEFFQYLQMAFVLVERSPEAGKPPRTLLNSQGIRLAGLHQVSGFFEQVGRNTDEILHPEEIIAANFALLALGERNVRSPEVQARIEKALAEVSAADPRP